MDCKQQQKLLLELEVQEPFQCIKDESSLKTLDRYTIFSTIGHQSHLLETTIYIWFISFTKGKNTTPYQPKKGKWVKGENAIIGRPFSTTKKREKKKISCCLSNESIKYRERKTIYRGQQKLLTIFIGSISIYQIK